MSDLIHFTEIAAKGSAEGAAEIGLISSNAFISPSSSAEAQQFTENLTFVQVGVQSVAIEPVGFKETFAAGTVTVEAEEDLVTLLQKRYSAVKTEVYVQAQKRFSRRLKLVDRAKKVTCHCPMTGIVSLLEVPALPTLPNGLLAHSLTYYHPLSELDNARGFAQAGRKYLAQLDTQVLAGILIVLCTPYELIKFKYATSGPQKNATLRVAGKDALIDLILFIEQKVHSINAEFLPALNLVLDFGTSVKEVETRIRSYIGTLADAVAKPDKERYDENAKPKKIGRVVLIKEVEDAAKKKAREEKNRLSKAFDEDKKLGKKLVKEAATANLFSAKMRAFLLNLFSEDNLLYLDSASIGILCNMKLIGEAAILEQIREIIRKDRSGLVVIDTDFGIDDIGPVASSELEQSDAKATLAANTDSIVTEETIEVEEIKIPEGLSPMQRVLWKKKYLASQANAAKENE